MKCGECIRYSICGYAVISSIIIWGPKGFTGCIYSPSLFQKRDAINAKEDGDELTTV